MRILATGVTRLECGAKPQLRYLSNAELLVEALERAGHVVDFRDVAPGEDLTGFDVAFVGLAPFLSATSDRLNPALDIIDRAATSGCALVLYVDDWNFTRLTSQLKTIVKYDGTHLVRPFFHSRKFFEWGCEHRERLTEVCRKLLTTPWPVTVIPTFTWGDHDRLAEKLPAPHVECVDPSAIAELRYAITRRPTDDRKREWVMGVLQNEQIWLSKQAPEWPVHYVGGRASKATGKLFEADLVQLYADSWGVLSPPHIRVLGTGWWRYRFVSAALARAVLVADAREVVGLDGPYLTSVAEVEAASPARLQTIADDQRDALRTARQPLESVVTQMSRIVTNAVPW